jgi:PAS domain S-box-containing protein
MMSDEVPGGNPITPQIQTTPETVTPELDYFFTMSVDLLCISGFDGYFKHLNPAWENTLGFSTEELMSRPFVEFVHPEDREKTLLRRERLASGTDTQYFENRYRCKDGSYRALAWRSAGMPERKLIYGAARDVTDRREQEAELRRLNEALAHRTAELEFVNNELESFTYSVSHDLRAPLRHIDGFSKLLADEHASELSQDAREFLGYIRESTHEMSQLVDDLLNLARIGRKPLEMRPTALSGVMTEVITGLQSANPGRAIEWNIEPLPFVMCDPSLMKQVFANLLSNAVKYTRQKDVAIVDVGTASIGDECVIFVRDNGVGFDMKHHNKLFGVFQRLHRQEDFEGTGVGLAIVQRIVHKHGGRIWAQAEVNRGATFFLTLNEAPPEQQLTHTSERETPHVRG